MSETLFIGGVADGRRIRIPDDHRGHFQVPIPTLPPIDGTGNEVVREVQLPRDFYKSQLFRAQDDTGKTVDFSWMIHERLTSAAAVGMLERGYLRPMSDADGRALDYPLNVKKFVAKAMEEYRTSQSWVGRRSEITIPEIIEKAVTDALAEQLQVLQMRGYIRRGP